MSNLNIKGIDISGYQLDLDHAAAKREGYEYCIVKVSEATSVMQSFEINYNKAKASGFKIGAYHFYRGGGLPEAQTFISGLYGKQLDIYPFIDIESTWGYEDVKTFINYVETSLGVPCGVYCNLSYAKELCKDSVIASKPLWLAYYGSSCPTNHGFNNLIGWQYTDKEYVAGVNTDKNYFSTRALINSSSSTLKQQYDILKDGTEIKIIPGAYWGLGYGNPSTGQISEGWLNSLNSKRLRIAKRQINNGSDEYYIYYSENGQVAGCFWVPVNSVQEVIHHLVVSGDTTWGIAQQYGTTVESIVKMNVIGDGSNITPGMILRVK